MIASQIAYQKIKNMMISGRLASGQKVSQVRLAKELGFSTVPVVEALRRLESEGLLVKEGRRMAKVRQLSAEEVEGLFLIRQGLEPIAARLCAERISKSALAHLQVLVEEFEAAVDADDNKTSDDMEVKIHRCIAENANCPLLLEELSRLLLIEKTSAGDMHSSDRLRYRRSHRAIVEAIAERDGDLAEFLMRRHIEIGRREHCDNT
jgi:DNA-binding GntR family transcriptional regulator